MNRGLIKAFVIINTCFLYFYAFSIYTHTGPGKFEVQELSELRHRRLRNKARWVPLVQHAKLLPITCCHVETNKDI